MGKGKGKNGKGQNGKGQWAKGVDDDEWAEGEEGEDDGQQADEGGSVWEEDADCVWAVSDDDEDDDRVYVITDAKHFVPDEDESEESEEEEEESEKTIYSESPFVDSQQLVEADGTNASLHSSVLASPPDRRAENVTTNSPKTPSAVDPWASGSDPWKQGVSTEFVDRYRKLSSPATSTGGFAERYRAPPTPTSAVALTRSLFESPADDVVPVVPQSEFVRPTRTVATNLSLAEARRVRFLPPCACEFPPGFADVLTSHVPTCESEQGAIQLADDGRAETHIKIDEIRDLIVDLQSVVCFRCRDLESCDKAIDVQSFDELVFHYEIEERDKSTENVREQNFPDYDLMSFVDVGSEASADCVDSVGTEGKLQNVVGTEVETQVLHDMQDFSRHDK
jgi:hypothetical protein